LELLEEFARERRPLRLKELAHALGQPTSSIAAILKTMMAQGYLSFDVQSHTYIPNAHFSQLLSWIPAEPFENGIVQEVMHSLRRDTNELIVLAAESGIYLEYVETLKSSGGMQLNIERGTRRLLVQTGTGWLFLNLRSRDEALDVYDRTVAAGELDARKFSRLEFLRRLDEQRDRDVSYVRARDLVMPTAHWGGAMISMLIPVPAGHRPLALGIGGPAERLEAHLEHNTTCLRRGIECIAKASTSVQKR
jgi:DNA-binding IclR family transcriptional regulator